jgi:hypothetical protein
MPAATSSQNDLVVIVISTLIVLITVAWYRTSGSVSTLRVDSSEILPLEDHASSKNLTVSNTLLDRLERSAHGANDEGKEGTDQ